MGIINGYFLLDIILNTNNWILNFLFSHHLIYSAMLSYFCIIWFVIALNRHNSSIDLLHYQYGQLAWNLTICIVNLAIAPILRVIFDGGLIWTVLPMSTVVANDVFAYGFGKLFGRHPLISLSPKKTWEGYIGSALATIPFGYALCALLMKYNSMLCSTNTLSFGLFECERDAIFDKQIYNVFGIVFSVEPFQIYNLWISVFIAIICPIGGFFASGYKRAFGKEDFGAIIPGHGGITDRMDAEVLMCGFVYFVHKTVTYSMSIDDIRNKAMTELTDEQISDLIIILQKLVQ